MSISATKDASTGQSFDLFGATNLQTFCAPFSHSFSQSLSYNFLNINIQLFGQDNSYVRSFPQLTKRLGKSDLGTRQHYSSIQTQIIWTLFIHNLKYLFIIISFNIVSSIIGRKNTIVTKISIAILVCWSGGDQTSRGRF